MIAIVDYGMGNLLSVSKALENVAPEVEITSDPAVIDRAAGIVLPGVGAFADCMHNLRSLGLEEAVKKYIESKRPYLGICLGLQILFSYSEEGGRYEGFGVIKGKVKKLPSSVKVPHMGWNQLCIGRRIPLFKSIPDQSNFYFVHSYYVDPEEDGVVAATTDYGISFTSSVWKENIYGVQFHPEKSSQLGLEVLRNFGRIVYDNLSGG